MQNRRDMMHSVVSRTKSHRKEGTTDEPHHEKGAKVAHTPVRPHSGVPRRLT